jgi:hypothetical protein
MGHALADHPPRGLVGIVVVLDTEDSPGFRVGHWYGSIYFFCFDH